MISEEEQVNLIHRWYLNALYLYSEKAQDEEFGRLEWERMVSVIKSLFTQSIVIFSVLEPSEQKLVEEALSTQGLGLELRWSKTVWRVCDAVIDGWENY